ncbi:MAG: hypothetical protein GTO17_13770 [Candidatus Aminicenantes bacterium]|nr:hypothetical protein [Candidatus Aminicenantes bacterium]
MSKMKISFSKEWLLVIIWSVLVIFLANIPYIYGYLLSTPEKMFLGDARSFLDTNTYLAWMHQAEDGHVLFKNIYTTEPHSRIFLHPLFLLLGNISRVSGFSLVAVHSWARIIFGFLLLLFIYVFVSYFVEDRFRRFFSFVIVSLSGGFAWLRFFPSIDRIPEAWFLTGWSEGNTFLTIYALPLFSLATLMLLASFYFLLRSFEENKTKYAVYGGVIAFFLILDHSYDVLIVYPVIALYVLSRFFVERKTSHFKNYLQKTGIFLALSLPAAVYDFASILLNPVFREWAFEASVTLSPHFIWYLGFFGFLSILSVAGILNVISDSEHPLFFRRLFLVVWAFSVPFLIYLPFKFQRRLIEGVHVPISILSVLGILFLLQKFEWKKKWAVPVFVLLLIPGNFTPLIRDMSYLKQNVSRESVAGFLDKDIYSALKWLEEKTEREDIVLADYEIGNYVPALSGNTVYIGHSPETMDFWGKWAKVKNFFHKDSSDAYRKEFLKTEGITYLTYTWREKKLGAFDPEKAPYLEPVYRNKTVTIFKVHLGE